MFTNQGSDPVLEYVTLGGLFGALEFEIFETWLCKRDWVGIHVGLVQTLHLLKSMVSFRGPFKRGLMALRESLHVVVWHGYSFMCGCHALGS